MADASEMETSAPPLAEAPRRAKKRQRCACATAEACFACRRCLEQHCVCGTAQRVRVAHGLCRESRACACRVVAPASSRCELCMGCRQAESSGVLSHCRCVAHQQLWRARKDDKKAAVGEPTCHCFESKSFQANRVDPLQARERRRSISLVKRRAGLPSSRGLYANKIMAPSVGVDEFGDECVELSDGDSDEDCFEIKPTSAEELEDAVHPVYVHRSRPLVDRHMLQGPLSWSRSQPYQQAMAAVPTRFSRAGKGRPGQKEVLSQGLTIETAERSLENAVFERDRDATLPSESLVDYLIFTASVKASRIPELIGSFDDTAATALAIVTEEYTKQLVLRSAREPLITITKRAVQAFTSSVLHDFDYAVYLRRCEFPALAQLSVEQIGQVTDDLARLVYGELVALQPPRSRGDTPQEDRVLGYIREVVRSEVESARSTSICEQAQETSKLDLNSLQKLKAVKLSHHASRLTGQRIYKYEVSADVGGKHRAKVALDGFESREAAEQSIQRIQRVLESESQRLDRIENPVVPPKVENPIITELYEQLRAQVRQSRATQQAPGTQSTGPSNTKDPNEARTGAEQ